MKSLPTYFESLPKRDNNTRWKQSFCLLHGPLWLSSCTRGIVLVEAKLFFDKWLPKEIKEAGYRWRLDKSWRAAITYRRWNLQRARFSKARQFRVTVWQKSAHLTEFWAGGFNAGLHPEQQWTAVVYQLHRPHISAHVKIKLDSVLRVWKSFHHREAPPWSPSARDHQCLVIQRFSRASSGEPPHRLTVRAAHYVLCLPQVAVDIIPVSPFMLHS